MYFSLTFFRKLLLGDFLESWVINKEEEEENEEGEQLLYFYLDNGSNVCGLEFNYKNGEEDGDSDLDEEKEDKKLEEGEETKQDKMEGLEENEDNKSLHADKADDETFYNDSSSLALKWNQEKAGGLTLSSRTGYKVCEEYMID